MRMRRGWRMLWVLIAVLGLAGCSAGKTGSSVGDRPDCVSLAMYSGVIEQVMDVTPEWGELVETDKGYQAMWEIQRKTGSHALTATLTPEKCICAAHADSRFVNGIQRESKLAGSLEGAAVAVISDLDTTTGWLEPKVTLSCSLAYLARKVYHSEEVMKDGTSWEMACGRTADEDRYRLSFSVTAPACTGEGG